MTSQHTCYACRRANQHRVFADLAGIRMARYPERFRGPPGNVNGGIVAGSLVCQALDHAAATGVPHPVATRVTARLRASVPIETPLDVLASGSGDAHVVSIKHHDTELVHGTVEVVAFDAPPHVGDLIAQPPPERADPLTEMGQIAVPERPPFWEETGEHPIPGCFSCGPDNPAGLHVFPRSVADGVTAAPWQPDPSFYDGLGVLSTMVLTAAIDCSSGICMPVAQQQQLLNDDAFFLLGSLDVRYLRVPPVAAGYRVVARARGRDGRKFFGSSALFVEETCYAFADATWIVAPITKTEAWGKR